MSKLARLTHLERLFAGQIVWRGQTAQTQEPIVIVRIYTDCPVDGGKARPTDRRHYVLHQDTKWVAGPTADEVGADDSVLRAFVQYAEREWGTAVPAAARRRPT